MATIDSLISHTAQRLASSKELEPVWEHHIALGQVGSLLKLADLSEEEGPVYPKLTDRVAEVSKNTNISKRFQEGELSSPDMRIQVRTKGTGDKVPMIVGGGSFSYLNQGGILGMLVQNIDDTMYNMPFSDGSIIPMRKNAVYIGVSASGDIAVTYSKPLEDGKLGGFCGLFRYHNESFYTTLGEKVDSKSSLKRAIERQARAAEDYFNDHSIRRGSDYNKIPTMVHFVMNSYKDFRKTQMASLTQLSNIVN